MAIISIKSKDEVLEIIERVLESEAVAITLEIPQVSNFGRSVLNFQLLKREADATGKTVTIDSKNEEVRKMASDAGLVLLGGGEEPKKRSSAKSVSDILPPSIKSMESDIDKKIREARKKREEAAEKKKKPVPSVSPVKTVPLAKAPVVVPLAPTAASGPVQPKPLPLPTLRSGQTAPTKASGVPEKPKTVVPKPVIASLPAMPAHAGQTSPVIKSDVARERTMRDELMREEEERRRLLQREIALDRSPDAPAGAPTLRRSKDDKQADKAAFFESKAPVSKELFHEEEAEPAAEEEGLPAQEGSRAGGVVKKIARIVLVAVILAALGGGVYMGAKVLPRARISVVMKKITWEYNDTVQAKADIGESLAEPITVPLEIIVLPKNAQIDLPVTGRKEVNAKAKGKITIYNAFSSQSQQLVATTRFLTPDNKLFRLDKNVVVPGAKIEGGKIVPSSIEAAVTADKPGEEFNIGPVDRFSIPGFEGTPRYEKFYAVSTGPMTGGLVGESTVVTQEDIDAATEKINGILSQMLEDELQLKLPEGFTSIEGMKETKVSEITFSHQVGDPAETLAVSSEVVLRTGLFREEDLHKVFAAAAGAALGYEIVLDHADLTYGVARVDYDKKEASFPVQYTATFVRKTDSDTLKMQLLGKDQTETKSLIFATPGLESADVSLWPFWVTRVPKNESRVTVELR